MKIRELRILPPMAIGRLGSAAEPVDNYTVEDDPDDPLAFRTIVPGETLVVDDNSGEIREVHTPETVTFKEGGAIKPVAPFLEVFAVTSRDKLVPLDLALLEKNGLTEGDVKWRVAVANRKVERRTQDKNDIVSADTKWFSGHDSRQLKGQCRNFVTKESFIELGRVRYIKPNDAFPEIRLRFTPAKGLIYGPDVEPTESTDASGEELYQVPLERRIYDHTKSWYGFQIPSEVSGGAAAPDGKEYNETLPPSLFAIQPPAPSWLNENIAVSRGYLDDACDGIVEVKLTLPGGEELSAKARITAAPPAVVPDALFVRSLADDLDQILHGPQVTANEPLEVTRARAEDIVRRAFETVRFMNVMVMNGNQVQGRKALSLDTMPAEEAFDTERLERPVMSPGTVDTLAVMALHQQVLAALRGGAAPWFVKLLRQPEEATLYTDEGRRKMPALMCGADNNYLALTHRQIDTIRKATEAPPFAPPFGAESGGNGDGPADGAVDGRVAVAEAEPGLTPRNLSAQLHYAARGNPVNSRPVTAIGNCCPGLEVDFRGVWRRMFKGIVLREYDNLVVDIEPGEKDPKKRKLKGHRLLRIRAGKVVVNTMAPMVGPSPADPSQEVILATESNPHAMSALEWSNSLAQLLRDNMGGTVTCDFTRENSWYDRPPLVEKPKNYISVDFEVRHFFEQGTAFIASELAGPGELTQGLCSPWQNDYRECSCYYWASARPDYVNVEVSASGLSAGDNWMALERTGKYIPDDYADTRLIHYDDLFKRWEELLRFQVQGKDDPRGEN